MGILHCHALLCCTTIIACQTNTLAKHPRYSYVPRQSSISIYTFSDLGDLSNMAPVVQTLDSAIQWLNLYPVDGAIGFPNTYPLDSDLSDG